MEVPDKTFKPSPSRIWHGANGFVARARQTGSVSLVAVRSFMGDLMAPRTTTEQVMASHARTFRFATRFLPAKYRDPTINLYAFFRTLDDLVDDSPIDHRSRAVVAGEIEAWDAWFRTGKRGGPPRPALARNIGLISSDHQIPSSIFLDFLEGMRADLNQITPETRDDVEHYSYQVASTVGITMAHVFGATNRNAIDSATRLGIAMQLTNILRDVGGDLDRGRVYLPASLLADHGLSRDDVHVLRECGNGPDERLRGAIREMIGWADEHYAAGIAGIRLLPDDVRMPILVSARLYQRILRQLERNGCDSLRNRAATTGWQKVSEAVRCAVEIERPGTDVYADVEESRADAV